MITEYLESIMLMMIEKQFLYCLECLDNDIIINKVGVKSKLFSKSLL